MQLPIARGVAVFRREYALAAAGAALVGLGLGTAINPWFFLVAGVAAVFFLVHGLYGHRTAESVLDLPEPAMAAGRTLRITPVESRNKRARASRILRSGPWRVITDPLSENRRLAPCGDVWTIVDTRDQVVFTGTKRDCEDWLDYQDNNA